MDIGVRTLQIKYQSQLVKKDLMRAHPNYDTHVQCHRTQNILGPSTG